ncbi:unnamed protein product [Ambrosiozyma monospora]|uniref:Unnamed protein product n=1 Tax=Ambrosiozyma monospora TaxID=43982 RepID=A0ACB5UCH9_AMBMO|nr:unnamed protein product [Ambrosiozyma monospora]
MNKAKKDYDAACQAMETQRSKSEKSSSDKAQHKYAKRQYEMNCAKNDYLIKISIANRLKDKYYYQDVPEILDGLQGLNEAKVSKLNSIWLTASSLEKETCNHIISLNDAMDVVVKQNLPKLDTIMFVKHNMTEWREPSDFYYIPSSIWHDDDEMIVDGNEKTMLKERLNSAGSTYEKLERICTDEKQQVAELVSHRTEIMGDTFKIHW